MSDGIVSKPGRSGAMTLFDSKIEPPFATRPNMRTVVASILAMGAGVPTFAEPIRRVKPLPNVPDHRPNAKKWTCKRCGEKFTPHRSPTYCDGCQAERMR